MHQLTSKLNFSYFKKIEIELKINFLAADDKIIQNFHFLIHLMLFYLISLFLNICFGLGQKVQKTKLKITKFYIELSPYESSKFSKLETFSHVFI